MRSISFDRSELVAEPEPTEPFIAENPGVELAGAIERTDVRNTGDGARRAVLLSDDHVLPFEDIVRIDDDVAVADIATEVRQRIWPQDLQW